MTPGQIVPVAFLPNRDDKWRNEARDVKRYIRINH